MVTQQLVIDLATGEDRLVDLTQDELAQRDADERAAAAQQTTAAATKVAHAEADAADAAALADLYPRLTAVIPALADPNTSQTPAELSAILAETLVALKGVVDRLRRKGL